MNEDKTRSLRVLVTVYNNRVMFFDDISIDLTFS